MEVSIKRLHIENPSIKSITFSILIISEHFGGSLTVNGLISIHAAGSRSIHWPYVSDVDSTSAKCIFEFSSESVEELLLDKISEKLDAIPWVVEFFREKKE